MLYLLLTQLFRMCVVVLGLIPIIAAEVATEYLLVYLVVSTLSFLGAYMLDKVADYFERKAHCRRKVVTYLKPVLSDNEQAMVA